MNTTQMINNKTSHRCLKLLVAYHPVTRLLAVSILGLLAVSATFHAQALPIKNGGFETGDLTGWEAFPAGVVTSAEAYGGSFSLELDPGCIVYQELDTLKRFGELEFYAKADDRLTDDTAAAFVVYRDGSSIGVEFGATLSDTHWTKVTFRLDNTKRVSGVLIWTTKSTPTPIYIDHVGLLD